MEIYVDKPTLDLDALEHFPGHSDGLVIPVLWDVGKKAEVERGLFGTVEPTVRLAVPIAPQVLGIDGNLVPVTTNKHKTERSGFSSVVRAGGPDSLQKSKEDGFEHFRGNSEYRKTRVVSGLPDYVPQSPLTATCLLISAVPFPL